MLTIRGKALGQRRPLFTDFSVPPPEMPDGDSPCLRDLIETVVRHEVAAFDARQHERQFVRALTAREIDAGTAAGKVDSGGSDVEIQQVDADAAVANALQAFEDRIYLVVVDEVEQQDLDAQVFLSPDSQLTFVRLTLLAGG